MDKPGKQQQDSASKSKLCLKIKMPNTITGSEQLPADEKQVELHGGDAGNNDHHPPGIIPCQYCDKTFSSGKAWGGHKRHHLKLFRENEKKNQEAAALQVKKQGKNMIKKHGSYSYGGGCGIKKNAKGDVKVGDGKPTCGLCGKKFPTMDSLFGHMRLHSDSDLKGIRSQSFNNSSSRLKFEEAAIEEDEDVYYNNNNHTNVNMISPVLQERISEDSVDLMSSLVGNGWNRKDSRGRTSSPELLLEAAHTLMAMSKDRNRLALTSTETSNLNVKEIGKKLRSKFSYIESNQQLNGTLRSSDPLKIKRKDHAITALEDEVAASEPEETGQESGVDQYPDAAVPMETRFRCDICRKIFSTGKALGGHKRCHRKPSSNEVGSSSGNSNTSSGEAAVAEEIATEGIDRNGMLGIDLNQPYVMKDGEEETSSHLDKD